MSEELLLNDRRGILIQGLWSRSIFLYGCKNIPRRERKNTSDFETIESLSRSLLSPRNTHSLKIIEIFSSLLAPQKKSFPNNYTSFLV